MQDCKKRIIINSRLPVIVKIKVVRFYRPLSILLLTEVQWWKDDNLPQSQCIHADYAHTSLLHQSSTSESMTKVSSCIQSATDLGNRRLTAGRQHSTHHAPVLMQSGVSAVSGHCTQRHTQTELQNINPATGAVNH